MKKICKDCGNEFELKDSEIGFYKSKGLELPKRCRNCRDKKNGKKSTSTSSVLTGSTSDRQASKGTGSATGYSSGSYSQSNSSGDGNKKLAVILIAAIAAVLMIGVISIINMMSKSGGTDYSDNVTNQVADTVISTVTDISAGENDTDNVGGNGADNSDSDDLLSDGMDNLSDDAQTFDTVDGDNALEETDNTNNTLPENMSSTESTTSVEPETTTPAEPEVTAPEPEVTTPVAVNYVFRNSRLLQQHYEKHGIEMGFDSAESYQAAASAVINNPDALSKTEAEDGDYVFYVEATNEFVILSTDGYIRTYFLPSGGKAYYDRQ